jgi:hypothetical protein
MFFMESIERADKLADSADLTRAITALAHFHFQIHKPKPLPKFSKKTARTGGLLTSSDY